MGVCPILQTVGFLPVALSFLDAHMGFPWNGPLHHPSYWQLNRETRPDIFFSGFHIRNLLKWWMKLGFPMPAAGWRVAACNILPRSGSTWNWSKKHRDFTVLHGINMYIGLVWYIMIHVYTVIYIYIYLYTLHIYIYYTHSLSLSIYIYIYYVQTLCLAVARKG